MKIVEQTATQQVSVYYKATDDNGDYSYQHTYQVAGTLPAVGTKERTAWNAARLAEQQAQYAAWRVVMATPVPAVTKETLTAERTRALADKVAAETKIATLTAAISKLDATVVLVKEEPEEKVK